MEASAAARQNGAQVSQALYLRYKIHLRSGPEHRAISRKAGGGLLCRLSAGFNLVPYSNLTQATLSTQSVAVTAWGQGRYKGCVLPRSMQIGLWTPTLLSQVLFAFLA